MVIRLGIDLKLFDSIANLSEQNDGQVTVNQIAEDFRADPKLISMLEGFHTAHIARFAMVEFVVAIDEARVRFTDDAFLFVVFGCVCVCSLSRSTRKLRIRSNLIIYSVLIYFYLTP
ncbi:hypothetical protein N7490_002840 [Penicillium lividum]|nr:hypothetical protein N7490_002840 [Penicillium lividum]